MNLFQLVKAFKKKSLDSNNHHEYMIDSICSLKGIVHPKMKILSSFTHPQVVPNLNECLCSAEHKGRYSEECGKQSSSGAPLTSRVFFFPTMKSMVPQNSLITSFLQISSFVFGRTKIQVWNYLRVSKWWQNFHFWVNYPFKPFFWSYCRQYAFYSKIKQMFVFLIFQSFSEMTFFSHLASLWPLILLI